MGYYTGSGIVASGGSVPSSGGAFMLPKYGGRGFLKKMTTTTVTKYPGVSLTTARGNTGVNNMVARAAWESDTGGYFYDVVFPDCSGNTTGYTYAQISDSNLYEVIKTETTVTVAVDRNIQSL